MEIELILVLEALPDGDCGQNVIIDVHRCSVSRNQLRHPTPSAIRSSRGEFRRLCLVARRYNESISRFQQELDLYPDIAWKRAELAWAYAMKGMYAQAIAEYDKIPEQAKAVAAENQLVASGLGWVYAISGRRADALKIAKEFKDLSSHAYVDFYQFAAIYAGLGDKDETFRLLEKAYEEHSSNMPFLAVDPFWYGMRSDP